MQSHGPCTLKGPVTQQREWWQRAKRKPSHPKTGVVPGIRIELVQRVRRAIAAGTYDTPEKLAMALDRMVQRLNLDR
jgi:hypothetical protein